MENNKNIEFLRDKPGLQGLYNELIQLKKEGVDRVPLEYVLEKLEKIINPERGLKILVVGAEHPVAHIGHGADIAREIKTILIAEHRTIGVVSLLNYHGLDDRIAELDMPIQILPTRLLEDETIDRIAVLKDNLIDAGVDPYYRQRKNQKSNYPNHRF